MEKGKIKEFSFNQRNQAISRDIIAKYPQKKSAVMPLLDLAQRQNNNYLSKEVIILIASMLEMTEVAVYEVASFYTMFNLNPVGKNLIQICGTTPCMLRGAEAIKKFCQEKLGVGLEELTEDGLFTLREVECLGACVDAPIVQINDYYHENLDVEKMQKIIEDLQSGKEIKINNVA
ncbi:NADH-quinone oxidoreductase subunit NuoE [Flavobacteriaceae bacterium]|nr:NADH-quinone oxidoreductase subunit NuoE [Flavobacteriaceae bacterium]